MVSMKLCKAIYILLSIEMMLKKNDACFYCHRPESVTLSHFVKIFKNYEVFFQESHV